MTLLDAVHVHGGVTLQVCSGGVLGAKGASYSSGYSIQSTKLEQIFVYSDGLLHLY